MKNFKTVLFAIVILSLAACDMINEKVVPGITGKPGDLLIVADSSFYNNKTGRALEEVFAKEQVGLTQPEPRFSIIHIPHHAFTNIFQTTRNIIIISDDKSNKTKISIAKDAWAKPQLIVTINASSDKIAAKTIEANKEVLLDYFNNKEIERLQTQYKLNKNSDNAKLVNEKFGLSLNIDELYFVAVDSDDFMWLRKEKTVGQHPVSQGLFIYTYPYVSDSTFKLSELMNKRDHYTKLHVEGGAEGSYMAIYREYQPVQREASLNGVYLNELRGLWQMEGDFMGGPFVNYSLVDEKKNRVICIDGYVYAPNFKKREYLRQLEALIKTITF